MVFYSKASLLAIETNTPVDHQFYYCDDDDDDIGVYDELTDIGSELPDVST